MLVDAVVTGSMIMFIVVFAGIFTWTASVIGIVDKAADLIVGILPNALVTIILSLLPILSLYLPIKAGLYSP
jgi:C4-dicarboxylate transporter DctM subunit